MCHCTEFEPALCVPLVSNGTTSMWETKVTHLKVLYQPTSRLLACDAADFSEAIKLLIENSNMSTRLGQATQTFNSYNLNHYEGDLVDLHLSNGHIVYASIWHTLRTKNVAIFVVMAIKMMA